MMAVLTYRPEMGEKRPEVQIEARLGHYGKHYFVDTPLVLSGRGIKHMGVFRGVPGSRKEGWQQYKLTEAAFEKLQAEHDVSYELLL
jgi:hypothetical protein